MVKSYKRRIILATITCFLLIILAFIIYIFIEVQPVSSNHNSSKKRIEVPSGMSVYAVSKKLKQEEIIKNDRLFYAAARYPVLRYMFTGASLDFNLKSGVYSLNNSMSYKELFTTLSSGLQEYIRISFPEGLTISKIATKLDENGVCASEEFKIAAKDKDLLKTYGIIADSFEGFLFPDTYFFNPSMKSSDVVCQMVDNFFEKIKLINGFTELSNEKMLYYVTLASIIEREYRIQNEAPLIASVFKNRLENNIGLYSCATIEYIITEIQGKEHPDVIRYEDLTIDSPYNTYKWAGLPPGPISNPGKIALDAALHPADTNYYFFRLVDANQGKHVFTKDFSTHVSKGYTYTTKKDGK